MKDTRRARLVLTILLLAAFTLVTLDYRSGALGGVRRVVSTVFGPVEGAVNAVVHPIGSWFSSIGHLGSYKHDNERLKKQLSSANEQLRLTDVQRRRLAQLQGIDRLAGEAQFTVVHAQVVAIGNALGFEQTATIDVGSVNGVKSAQTVIDADGLVGRTIHVGRTTSTVLLASDPDLTVGARLEKSGELGSVTGGGRGPLRLELFNPTASVSVGDRLVTAGLNNEKPFVPAVPIGHVIAVAPVQGALDRIATVAPYVNYTAVDEVAVVVKAPPTIKRNALLPPSPSPTPTPTVTVTVTVTATPGKQPHRSGSASAGATSSSSP